MPTNSIKLALKNIVLLNCLHFRSSLGKDLLVVNEVHLSLQLVITTLSNRTGSFKKLQRILLKKTDI